MLYPFFKAGATDLVKDYDIKEFYPDINQNTPWANLKPYLRHAIQLYVLPYVGQTLYNDICTKIQAETALTDEQELFAEKLKDVCAHYAIMHMLPKKKTIIASMGAVGNVGVEGTTSSNIWEYKTTLWSLVQDADRLMDNLLAYLQKMVDESVAYFVTNWKEEPAFTEISSGFFRQTKDFQKYHPINNSLRQFKALVPMMTEVSERIILPILCQDQYDRLLEAISDGDATAAETKLLDKVRKVVAKFTIYEAAIGLPILSEREGFRVISNTDAIDRLAFDSEALKIGINGLREHSEKAGKTATADLVKFLWDNEDDYPLWSESTCNKSTNPDTELWCDGPGAVML